MGSTHISVGILAARQAPQQLDAGLDLRADRTVAVLRDAPGGDAQQRAAQLEHLVDLVDGALGHARATPRLDADQAVALEDA